MNKANNVLLSLSRCDNCLSVGSSITITHKINLYRHYYRISLWINRQQYQNKKLTMYYYRYKDYTSEVYWVIAHKRLLLLALSFYYIEKFTVYDIYIWKILVCKLVTKSASSSSLALLSCNQFILIQLILQVRIENRTRFYHNDFSISIVVVIILWVLLLSQTKWYHQRRRILFISH